MPSSGTISSFLDGASDEFDQELVNRGELSPVFFGSALTNFGVETFLEHFLNMTSSPLPRKDSGRQVDPFDEKFSAFVFKIQAQHEQGPQGQDRVHADLFRKV